MTALRRLAAHLTAGGAHRGATPGEADLEDFYAVLRGARTLLAPASGPVWGELRREAA